MTADVFISYRGADRALARKLEQRLRSRWGSRVFRDETGLQAGASWADELQIRLKQADVVIALVGPGWSVRNDPNQEDWVRAELLAAVERGTPILPVLVGDPDELRPKLSALSTAFDRQAIVVSPDLTLAGVQKIVRSLRQLGAFEGVDPDGLATGRNDLVSDEALSQCRVALDQERPLQSVFIEGAGGSGRSALLRRIVHLRQTTSSTPRRFVCVSGLDAADATRSTHAVMGAWFASLARNIEQLPLRQDRTHYGHCLVDAVLSCGPDLLSRRVIPVGLLLALGDDSHDHQVLMASRRPTERWAPYPPRRLVIQARSVLETFVETAPAELDVVVADVDSVDASSRDLMADLLNTSRPIRLVFTASPSPEEDHEALARVLPAVRQHRSRPTVKRVKLDEPSMWGDEGSPLPKWLGRRGIALDAPLLAHIDDPNPYYALASLWFLTDEGFIVDDARPAADDGAAQPDARQVRRDPTATTQWRLEDGADRVPKPTRSALLEYVIGEYVPVALHPLLQAGALVGRTFPFDIVHDAVDDAPHADDATDAERAAAAQQRDADWAALCGADPDNMVLTGYEYRNERYVTFALDDLLPHLVEGVSGRRRAQLHASLATAFAAAAEADADGDNFDAKFRWVALAAEHWERAGGVHLRTAADAHRRAAVLAERALAYREAERHYRVGIRLLSQLIADTSDASHDHEDLLIVANCQYRLGQMVRLSGAFTDEETGSPKSHYDHALANLNSLRFRLRNREFVSLPDMEAVEFARDIPGPDRQQHLLRLCDALSGYVSLDTATWYSQQGQSDRARDALFEALRCAELAGGEADSRWLLAAASARLAESLAGKAIDLVERGPGEQRTKAHELAVEALYFIERVVGLRPATPDEERDLAEPKALARDVFGQIVTKIHGKPRLAEWVYRKLNLHGDDVRVAEDMSTDFRLGQFLLSIVTLDPRAGAPSTPITATPELDEAGALLERYAAWARKSGLREALAPALNRLAIVEIMKAGGRFTDAASQRIAEARIDPPPTAEAETLLLYGFLHALPGAHVDAEADAAWAGPAAKAARRATVTRAFRDALACSPGTAAAAGAVPSGELSDDDVLVAGWRRVAELLLPLCPSLGLLALERARDQIDGALNSDHDPMRRIRQRADRHVHRVEEDPYLKPTNDRAVEQLAEIRLGQRAFARKKQTLATALELLDVHMDDCTRTEHTEPDVLRRDLRWAIYLYDWYDDVEPARLLVLAAEWHQRVNGSQWATPQLLRGPLAMAVLEDQFDARADLGTERFDRIARLVEQRAIGSERAKPFEQVFFLAVALAETDLSDLAADGDHWSEQARRQGELSRAYGRARAERVADLVGSGRPVETTSHEALTGGVVFDAPDPATLATTGP